MILPSERLIFALLPIIGSSTILNPVATMAQEPLVTSAMNTGFGGA